jgi:hypothetical protein
MSIRKSGILPHTRVHRLFGIHLKSDSGEEFVIVGVYPAQSQILSKQNKYRGTSRNVRKDLHKTAVITYEC